MYVNVVLNLGENWKDKKCLVFAFSGFGVEDLEIVHLPLLLNQLEALFIGQVKAAHKGHRAGQVFASFARQNSVQLLTEVGKIEILGRISLVLNH